MSKKHNQRTRAEILAKREQPIRDFLGNVAQVTRSASRSKYMPHIGAKEQERASRLYASQTLCQMSKKRLAEFQAMDRFFQPSAV
jgi:hypothetical protein